jgi:hypothetical protein
MWRSWVASICAIAASMMESIWVIRNVKRWRRYTVLGHLGTTSTLRFADPSSGTSKQCSESDGRIRSRYRGRRGDESQIGSAMVTTEHERCPHSAQTHPPAAPTPSSCYAPTPPAMVAIRSHHTVSAASPEATQKRCNALEHWSTWRISTFGRFPFAEFLQRR